MLSRTVLIAFVTSLIVSSALVGQEVQRFAGETPRASIRIAYFGQNTSEGQFAIDYGQPEWKPEYETQFDELTKGKRWRLGNNFWTTLDTDLDLTIAGVEVPLGYYYLVLERSPADDWSLILLDPKQIREQKLDASMASQTTGGIRAPLTWEREELLTPTLTIELAPNEGDETKATLEILWGRHKLTAPIDVKL